MYSIVVDVHEPAEIKNELRKLPLTVVESANAGDNLADYYWHNGDRLFIWERKKPAELVSEIGNILDTQLLKYTDNYPNALIGIIQEGLITSTENGLCQAWAKRQLKNRKKPIYTTARIVPLPYRAYQAYIWRRFCEGIFLVQTDDAVNTARTLGSFVYNSYKVQHMGLNRNVVVKSDVKKPYETHLATFPGIGMQTATKLVKDYKTPWDLYRMPYSVLVDFVGDRLAASIFKGIGKRIPKD